jgi:putative tryptophan/tyrosine transport system substrate-binding protein
MRRRDFTKGIVGSAAAWPFAALAQQSERMRRIGVLTPYSESDPYAKAQFGAFVQGLAELGWSEGHNLRMDVRWAAGDLDRVRVYAKELVTLQPDVILVDSTPQTAALQRETRTIPIVFVVVSDPVGSGFVAGLPRPGGNMTGFSNQDPSMGGKWVELLTEIAPNLSRVAAMFNPDTAPFVRSYYLPPFEAAARSLKVEPVVVLVHSDTEIETAITSLGRESGGLVIMPDAFLVSHRASIISLANRNNVPAVSQTSFITRDGGLISYGPDLADLYRRGADYVDRVLRGTKPSELPVQLPAKFEMAVNLKTAKALGLAVPQSLLARADEVIE